MEITDTVFRHRETLHISGYDAYRAQLSRQICSLRRVLQIQTPRREKFRARPLEPADVGKNRRFVELRLLTCERAWAHAMQMKSIREGEVLRGKTRRHVISRLHKAARSARELAGVLTDKACNASDRDLLEARAYGASLEGAEALERLVSAQNANDESVKSEDRWMQCLKKYSEARVIYAALLENEKREVFKEILAGLIDPTLRHAAYQSRIPRTVPVSVVAQRNFPADDEQLVKMIESLDAHALQDPSISTSEQKASTEGHVPNTITWRGRKAKIVDASIGQALAAVAKAEASLKSFFATNSSASHRVKSSAYDEVLVAAQDAADATKHALDELEREKVDEGDSRVQELRVTSLAVNYDLVSWRIGRNRVLIGSDDGVTFNSQPRPMAKGKRAVGGSADVGSMEESRSHKLGRLRERLVLYDAIIQSIDSVKELRGAMRDATFVQELDSGIAYFRALKCLNIAFSHSLNGESVKALALLHRGEEHSKEISASSKDEAPSEAPPKLSLTSLARERLVREITSHLSRTHALVELHSLATTAFSQPTHPRPLVTNLDDFPPPGQNVNLHSLVAYPPRMEPVPVKPILLDLAWNYIEFPGHTRAASAVAGAEEGMSENRNEVPSDQQKKSKGWFGFGRG